MEKTKSINDIQLKEKAFVLLSPVHNEINEIEPWVECVKKSTFRPDVWIIVDDSSTDGSYEKLLQLSKELPFLFVFRLTGKHEYMGFHYSEVLRFGVEKISKLRPSIGYVGILDADIRFAANYWFRLKQKLDSQPDIGIVSGTLLAPLDEQYLQTEPLQRSDNPRGGMRLIRGDVFFAIGGVERSRAPDSIQNVKARSQGWKTLLLQEEVAVSTRPTDEKINSRNGNISRGQRDWHLHKSFFIILITALMKTLKGDLKGAFYYLKGYFSELITKGERFPDSAVKRYYRYDRLREWGLFLWRRFSGKAPPFKYIPVKKYSKNEIFRGLC